MRSGLSPSAAKAYSQSQERNAILLELPPDSYTRLRPYLTPVELSPSSVLWDADAKIEHVYFPQTCVLSLLVPLRGSDPVEAATIGNEGIAGASAALGGEKSSTRAVAQVPGDALRISAGLFRTIVEDDNSLRLMALRFSQALLDQTVQSVACNRRHATVQRCARWILMTHDRAGADTFPLTRRFLALMLGVHKPCVASAARKLQRQRLIRYAHGRVTILDRPGLEAAACECYACVETRFRSLFQRMRSTTTLMPAAAS